MTRARNGFERSEKNRRQYVKYHLASLAGFGQNISICKHGDRKMFTRWFDIAQNATINLPALEVVLLLAMLAVFLVARLPKIGLITAYIFAYRWGWNIFVGHNTNTMLVYLVFGVIVGVLTAAGMMRSTN